MVEHILDFLLDAAKVLLFVLVSTWLLLAAIMEPLR